MKAADPGARGRGHVLAAILLGTFLSAIDGTIVGAAMPTIVADLRGLELYAWVVSAYLLTATTTVPVYGRLADMFGRKRVYLVGIGFFMAGSMLSGLATSMVGLIVFRALQGLGAGCVQPIGYTIIGDLYPLEQRARMQGLFSGVWGLSSVLGPLVGPLVIDTLGWRWIFYLNVPAGLLAMALIARSFHERKGGAAAGLDVAGAALLTTSIAAGLLALLDVLAPAARLGAAAVALVTGALFVRVERRVADPMLPFSIFSVPAVRASVLTGFFVGGVMFGVISFMPLFVQGVLGGTARHAGAALIPMAVGWPIGATIAGRLLLRHGYRRVVVAGGLLLVAGTWLATRLDATSTRYGVIAAMGVLGLGLGTTTTVFVVSLQNAVGWEQRGMATALGAFARSIGGTLGVGVLGAVLVAGLRRALPSGAVDPNLLLSPATREALGPRLHELAQGLSGSLHVLFLLLLGLATVALVLSFGFPAGDGRASSDGSGQAGGPGEADGRVL